jgi:transposase
MSIPVFDGVFDSVFAPTSDAVNCTLMFENYPRVFGIVDASPVFIQRPIRHADQYYSGEYRRHCAKVQVLVTPDGQCVHYSQVFLGRTYDKAIFDASGLRYRIESMDEEGRDCQNTIMGDLGYLGIIHTCPKAILPHKHPPHGQLTEHQKEVNRRLFRDRILVENFFGRWKALFGICHKVYRTNLKELGKVIQLTLALTNWYIHQHPLRRVDEEKVDESSDELLERNLPVYLLDADSSDSEPAE